MPATYREHKTRIAGLGIQGGRVRRLALIPACLPAPPLPPHLFVSIPDGDIRKIKRRLEA